MTKNNHSSQKTESGRRVQLEVSQTLESPPANSLRGKTNYEEEVFREIKKLIDEEHCDNCSDGICDICFKGSIYMAVRKAKEDFKKMIDEDNSNNYSVPESIDLFKNKLKSKLGVEK